MNKLFAYLLGFLGLTVVALVISAIVLSRLSLAEADRKTYVPPIDESVPKAYNGEGQVIIVGAGASGLFAGYTLEYLGVPFTILEASPTFGGRVQRMEDFVDVPIDIGAEWIHTNPQILQDLLLIETDQESVKSNIETIGFQPQSFSLWAHGRRVQRNWMRFFYKEYKFKSTTWSQWLENYIVPYVQDHIVYNAVVQHVDYSETGDVSVTTADGVTYTGSKVIMAVPLKVLQDHDIQFSPALPADKTKALEEVYWAPGFKVFIEFQERFYTDMTMDITLTQFLQTENDYRIFFNGVFGKDQTSRNLMTLFCVGEPAREWSRLSDKELFETVLARLDQLYDGEASKQYIQHRIQNWSNQPFIRGAYAFSADSATIERPVGDKLFFATDTEIMVHSAALSGRRAAVEAVSNPISS
ncbi:specific histone demethylase 1B [Seminavis robusta]|uniref:Specific histone demethylase 1B n=1 Tax=Seminavis robusta TaxID=568900 RepID=A0A9N8HMM9_9STRA|nr:specific histone demethylase 1B [Seminavis robusta]|eukprot:Sro913_g219440.1 specific histone demethylase 1B (413) ;mRNA; f:21724-22962